MFELFGNSFIGIKELHSTIVRIHLEYSVSDGLPYSSCGKLSTSNETVDIMTFDGLIIVYTEWSQSEAHVKF